jgi:nucleotide-binding universal stress UspA family protein
MSVILVGVDDSDQSTDAVDFARELAEDTGARVIVASTFPYDDVPSRAANLEYRAEIHSAAEHTVRTHARRVSVLGDRVSTATVARTSPAHGLQDLAIAHDAALIIVGSTHTGPAGRVLPGSTGERLLHGAPCSVAVVPKDRDGAPRALRTIGVAWDGSQRSDAALAGAVDVARSLGARLRVIRVADVPRESERRAAEELDQAVDGLPRDVPAAPVFLVGEPVHELCRQSESLDLLITGSRGYGPLRAVLLGGVTGRLLRSASCPVLVVPRGIEAPLAGLFHAAAGAGSYGPRARS